MNTNILKLAKSILFKEIDFGSLTKLLDSYLPKCHREMQITICLLERKDIQGMWCNLLSNKLQLSTKRK